jgi:hypothetical protein
MTKYILTYEGSGPSLDDAIDIVAKSKGVSFLETLGDNIVVEGAAPLLKALMTKLPGWQSGIVRKVEHPDNRIHVKRPW